MSGLNPSYIAGYANSITGIINGILVPVLISIAFIVFLWGIYMYFIQGAANDEARKKGRIFALYGIIGFVILFSIWGIIQIFMGTLGLTASNVPAFPVINGSTGSGSSVPAYGSTVAPSFPGSGNYIGGSISGTPSNGSQSIGQSCTTNNQCFGVLTCQSGTCVRPLGSNGCAVDSTPTGENGECVRTPGTATLGESCTGSSDCYGTDLFCGSQNICVKYGTSGSCPTGYIPDDTSSSGCAPDPSAQYGASGSCPTGYIADDNATTGCAPDPSAQYKANGSCPDGYVTDESVPSGCVLNPNSAGSNCTDPYATNSGSSGPCEYGPM